VAVQSEGDARTMGEILSAILAVSST